MFKSGICIAKRIKKCNCTDSSRNEKNLKPSNSQLSNESCQSWCNRSAVAGSAWCGKVFKAAHCQVACLLAVELLREGCNWCCAEGTVYKRCIKPFENIADYVKAPCDPYWD